MVTTLRFDVVVVVMVEFHVFVCVVILFKNMLSKRSEIIKTERNRNPNKKELKSLENEFFLISFL